MVYFLHGMTKTRTFKSWESILQRCNNPNAPDYPRWGGVGVKVCERWLKFENFYADMGERPLGTSIDRHPNPNGNYEPGNCRWATPSEQQRNKRNSRHVTYKGETKPLIEWAQETGIPYDLLLRRVARGDPEHKLFAPSRSRKVSRFDGLNERAIIECDQCGGSGFDTPGSGYGNVCGKCGGQGGYLP